MTDTGPSHHAFSRRLSFIYGTAAAGLAGLSLFWCVTLFLMHWWFLAFTEGVLATVCILTWLLIRSGRVSLALIVSQLAFYAVIMIVSLLYDIPSSAAPRVTHLFLLALAFLGYINHLREPSRLQLGVIAVSLMSFVALASTELGLPWATPLPDSVRIPGSWLNTIVAVTILCGCVYAMQTEFARKSGLVRELQAAAFGDQFFLLYQPQVDGDGHVIGAEALLRWQHPKRGTVPPLDFIPVAEQNGLMTIIGGWVLEQACRTLATWQRDPITSGLRLAVNVSAGQYLDPGFEQFVLGVTARHGVDRSKLKLELTESVMVANTEAVIATMAALKGAGIGTALDDFGTGYSSLGYLNRLPLDQLKIDRSFVQNVLESERSAALARSAIQLGKDLGMSVLAEGVETQEQFDFLRQSGCGEFQGYLFGRPVPLADLAIGR